MCVLCVCVCVCVYVCEINPEASSHLSARAPEASSHLSARAPEQEKRKRKSAVIPQSQSGLFQGPLRLVLFCFSRVESTRTCLCRHTAPVILARVTSICECHYESLAYVHIYICNTYMYICMYVYMSIYSHLRKPLLILSHI